MMRSKIVQLAIDPSTDEATGIIYALCEDGSVWWKLTHVDSPWSKDTPPFEMPKDGE